LAVTPYSRSSVGSICSNSGTLEGYFSLGSSPHPLPVSFIDRVICRADRLNRTVCCLPGARVRHVVDRVDRLLGGAGDDPAVMVHIGTNDKVSGRWKDLKNDFRELGSKLKKRSSKVVFSEILPVPHATVERQREIREVNAWLKAWCRKEGFGFLEHWAHFALGYNLYSCDRLHLNGRGSAVLGERMVKRTV
uniref:SGNH hydrolase-type esterase domain-containing protein n=1 Tax=Leptobrachium leishanense TaxID=445787 RepID=A0A8C5M2I2_9ANUR